jgi:hypothetical protein
MSTRAKVWWANNPDYPETFEGSYIEPRGDALFVMCEVHRPGSHPANEIAYIIPFQNARKMELS